MAITQAVVDEAQQEKLGHLTVREWTAVAHLRGWCHYGPACPICLNEQRALQHIREAFDTGRRDGIREIAEG